MPKSAQRRSRKAAVGASGLIDIAEQLFARDGLDVVSLRHVAACAGLSNPASVQYHFGNREQLIRAIWQKRLPQIEQLRTQRFAALMQREDQPSIEALLDCAHRPFLDGFETFAWFLARVLHSSYHLKIRREFDSLSPMSFQILKCIRKQLPPLDEDVFIFRMATGTLIVLNAIGPSHSVTPTAWRKSSRQRAYFEAIAAAVGVLQAPPAASLATAMGAKSTGPVGKPDRRPRSRGANTIAATEGKINSRKIALDVATQSKFIGRK